MSDETIARALTKVAARRRRPQEARGEVAADGERDGYPDLVTRRTVSGSTVDIEVGSAGRSRTWRR